jgi:hypothetical protein
MKFFFLSPLVVFSSFLCSLSAHENDGFHPLHLVFSGARCCRGCNLLPRISGLKWTQAAQGAGLRRLRRCSGMGSGWLGWSLRWFGLYIGVAG